MPNAASMIAAATEREIDLSRTDMNMDRQMEPIDALLRAADALRAFRDADRDSSQLTLKTTGALIRLIEGWCIDHSRMLLPGVFKDTDPEMNECDVLTRLKTSVQGADALPAQCDSPPAAEQARRVLCLAGSAEEGRLYVEFGNALGWEVMVADTARDGLAFADATPFDVILVASELDGMTGMKAVAHIRKSDGPNAGTPVLYAIDGRHMPGYREIERLGIEALEFKPLLLSTFRIVVSNLAAASRNDAPANPPESD